MSTLKPHPPGLHTKIEYMYSGFSHIFRNIIFRWFSKMYQLCHLGFFSFCSVQIQINVVKLRYIYISGCFDLVFTCRLSKFKSLNSVWKDKCHFSLRWEIKYFLLFLYQYKYLTLWNEKKDNINITLFKANNFFFIIISFLTVPNFINFSTLNFDHLHKVDNSAFTCIFHPSR